MRQNRSTRPVRYIVEIVGEKKESVPGLSSRFQQESVQKWPKEHFLLREVWNGKVVLDNRLPEGRFACFCVAKQEAIGIRVQIIWPPDGQPSIVISTVH